MEAEALELEDGEVVDDETIDDFGIYNILQRPHVAKTCEKPPKTCDSEDSDETSASASESDSDSTPVRVKRPKVKIKRRRMESQSSRDKSDKYKIWCTQVQEESLTEELVSCGVTKKLYQGRNVENYDFPLHFKPSTKDEMINNSSEDEREPPARLNNKRTYADRGNVKLRIGKRRNSMEVDTQRGSAKIMAELRVTGECTDDDVAADIAEKLNEQKDSLIKRVVDIIGKQEAMEFYEKTRKIEEGGGMLIMNGSRRRTAGGIYLWLVKNDEHIPQEKIREIFSADKKQIEQRKKADASNRRQKTQELMRSLENGSEKDLPALLTRAELSTRQIAEEARLRRGEGMDRNLPDSEHTVSNPPPSPVTDDPDHSEHHHHHHPPPQHRQQQPQPQPRNCASPTAGQRRVVQSYNDDFLDIGLDVDSMEVF